jgi:hypothetical protein
MTPDQRKRFEEAAEKYADNIIGADAKFRSDYSGFIYGRVNEAFLAGIEHATKWIDCKERLPEPEDDVLWCAYPIVEPPTVSSMLTAGFHYKTYTHWQPLPSPPSTPTV